MTSPIVGTDGNALSLSGVRGNAATANNFNVEIDSFNVDLPTHDNDDLFGIWEQQLLYEEDSSYDSDEFDLDFYSYVFVASEECTRGEHEEDPQKGPDKEGKCIEVQRRTITQNGSRRHNSSKLAKGEEIYEELRFVLTRNLPLLVVDLFRS